MFDSLISILCLPIVDCQSSLSSSIRNRLTALKKNRGEYIKVSDVNVLYQAIVKQGRFNSTSVRRDCTDHRVSIPSVPNITYILVNDITISDAPQ